MSLLIVLTLILSLCLGVVPTTAADVPCADLIEGMRDLHWRVRQGHVPDNEQQALWRTWNQACTSPQWQARLVREAVSVSAHVPIPTPLPSLTWRDYAGAILLGLAEGAARPTVYCSTTTYGRGARTRTSTHCY